MNRSVSTMGLAPSRCYFNFVLKQLCTDKEFINVINNFFLLRSTVNVNEQLAQLKSWMDEYKAKMPSNQSSGSANIIS